MKSLSDASAVTFRKKVYGYYYDHGRPFPWRNVDDPYDILVSEVMLQQTQADRVVPKYRSFMNRFPDVNALSEAPFREVLAAWQGLGYNRRAMNLHRCARVVAMEMRNRFPETLDDLRALPGIGPYTAAAIMAFAYNRPAVVNETNIRSVYLHEFFPESDAVPDAELEPLIEATMDRENPREWYQALMDYGAMLKKTGLNPSRRSAHYSRQSPLKGSNREVRGAIIKALMERGSLERKGLAARLGIDQARVALAVRTLVKDGMIRVGSKRLIVKKYN